MSWVGVYSHRTGVLEVTKDHVMFIGRASGGSDTYVFRLIRHCSLRIESRGDYELVLKSSDDTEILSVDLNENPWLGTMHEAFEHVTSQVIESNAPRVVK